MTIDRRRATQPSVAPQLKRPSVGGVVRPYHRCIPMAVATAAPLVKKMRAKRYDGRGL